MKNFFKVLLALIVMVVPVYGYAQTPVVDSINFKGNTNIFVWTHGTGAPSVMTCSGSRTYTQDDDITGQPIWTCKGGTMVHTSGSGVPAVTANQGVAANNLGALATVPEKGFSTASGTTSVAWSEDYSNGVFDCRNPKYAGGCLGGTPGLAMQAFSDAMVCYQGITGKHARTTFPPGYIALGTDAQPTLKLPTGAIYNGGGGWGFGTMATQFTSQYNNHTTLEFDNGLTSTTLCSDGVAHTSNMTAGSYDGFYEHGCAQGGCRNAPGDSGNYPFGGPNQIGIAINDADGSAGQKEGIFAANNGADGVLCNGSDSHCFHLGGAANNGYFVYGMDTSGQNYQFANGECHGEVVLGGLDNMNPGPFETYGQFATPGAEYGHLAGICWSGGLTWLGPYFLQIEEIGIIHMTGGNTQTGAMSGRIDAPRGTGILEMGNGQTTWDNPRVISACRFDGQDDYIVASVAVATAGTGQTPGTYLLTASSGSAQISVTVAAGGTVTAAPVVTVHGRGYTSTPPTFTLAAGGTPATFTVTMHSVFYQAGSGTPNVSCSYITELSAGHDTYISPLTINNNFFSGSDHSTGDFYPGSFGHKIITPTGNGPGNRIKIDPSITSTLNQPTNWQNAVIDADPVTTLGGIQVSGSVIDLNTTGYHVKMNNGSPTTLTNVINGQMSRPIYIVGDGFTTMPYLPTMLSGSGVTFGAVNCSGANLLLLANRRYTFEIVQGQALGALPVLIESCDSINKTIWDVNWDPNPSAVPTLEQQGTLDVIGSAALHPIPAPGTFGGQSGGVPDGVHGFTASQAYVYVVWLGGGKVISALSASFTICLPAPGFINNPCFQNVIFTLPQGWTRYQLYRNVSSDSVATPGLILDVTAPGSAPQPTQTASWEDTRIAPINSTTIPSGWYGITVTGTLSSTGMAIPTGSSFPGVPGQMIRDEVGGYDYYCDADDHWKRTPLTWSTF